jgi:hypothetical protein
MHHLDGHYAITLKLTAEQHRWLTDAAEAMSRVTDAPFGQQAVLQKLLELGLPRFEDDLALLRERQRALDASRRPRLKVVVKASV